MPITFWMRFSEPIAVLALAAAVTGLVAADTVYADETRNWAAQATGQDIVNLLIYPAMVFLARAARRGDERALLAWTGTLGYSVYNFAICAFALSFGPLFLVYVAILGLSAYALGGALLSGPAVRPAAAETRLAARVLTGVGVGFALLWLGETIPATLRNAPSEALRDTGLAVNPVHVLDLGLLLPAALICAAGLRAGSSSAYRVAPALLGTLLLLGLGIVTGVAVLAARDLATAPAVAAAMLALCTLLAVTLTRYLRSLA